MAKNPKVNINVGAKNYVSFSQRLKNAATIRKMWKILRAMDCERADSHARTAAR